jgi:hypothetical protein
MDHVEYMIRDFIELVRNLQRENKSLKRMNAAAQARIIELEAKYEADDVSKR